MLPFYRMDDRWNPRGQAWAFWNMVCNGLLTLEQAKKDILMTRKQRSFLIAKYQLPTTAINEIFEQRTDTWKEFLFLCAHPESGPKYKSAMMLTVED